MDFEFKEISLLYPEIRQQIRTIWNEEYPEIICEKSKEKFDAYIDSLEDAAHTLVLDEQKKVQGWYADFNRDNDRWFLIILSTKLQRKGIGKQLIERAQQKHNKLNGWAIFSDTYKKADKTFYSNPIGFYEKLGFCIRRDITFETKIMKTLKIEWQK